MAEAGIAVALPRLILLDLRSMPRPTLMSPTRAGVNLNIALVVGGQDGSHEYRVPTPAVWAPLKHRKKPGQPIPPNTELTIPVRTPEEGINGHVHLAPPILRALLDIQLILIPMDPRQHVVKEELRMETRMLGETDIDLGRILEDEVLLMALLTNRPMHPPKIPIPRITRTRRPLPPIAMVIPTRQGNNASGVHLTRVLPSPNQLHRPQSPPQPMPILQRVLSTLSQIALPRRLMRSSVPFVSSLYTPPSRRGPVLPLTRLEARAAGRRFI